MVFEATYLVAALTPGHASACCGQYAAQISKVLRPNNKSNGKFICLLRTVPRISSENGAIHPPYAKPPLVSSSGPPGAWMIPSMEICSSTITFLMTEFLQHLNYYLVTSFKVVNDVSNTISRIIHFIDFTSIFLQTAGRHRQIFLKHRLFFYLRSIS